VDAQLYSLLRSLIDNLAVFDALSSLAHVARFVGYCRATIVDESNDTAATQIAITGARHPTVEQLLAHGGEQYVPNDVVLNFDKHMPNSLVITGPNMGGKSSYVRMIAICCIMAQVTTVLFRARLCT
jgi:DNA mismatch repair protein MSH3